MAISSLATASPSQQILAAWRSHSLIQAAHFSTSWLPPDHPASTTSSWYQAYRQWLVFDKCSGYIPCYAKYLMYLFYSIESSQHPWEARPAVSPYYADEKQKTKEVNEPARSHTASSNSKRLTSPWHRVMRFSWKLH